QAVGEGESQPAGGPDFSWPEKLQRERAWQRPFYLSLGGVVTGGVLLLGTRKASGFWGIVRLFVLWPLTLTAAIIALITYFSKESPWIHVRVKSRTGEEFSVSLPFPAEGLQKALRFARDQVEDEDVREKIDAAAEILAEMDTGDLKDPIVIDINDEGESVQVFLN
ncbi:MAG: hypothetical protein ACK2UP_10025, partial [Candidatus Promineifilaceae bacterium]